MSLISELMGKHLRHEPELKNSRRNVMKPETFIGQGDSNSLIYLSIN